MFNNTIGEPVRHEIQTLILFYCISAAFKENSRKSQICTYQAYYRYRLDIFLFIAYPITIYTHTCKGDFENLKIYPYFNKTFRISSILVYMYRHMYTVNLRTPLHNVTYHKVCKIHIFILTLGILAIAVMSTDQHLFLSFVRCY